MHEDLYNRYGQAATWDSLGNSYQHLGDRVQAITCYQHSLDLQEELGERHPQAEVLTKIGDTHDAAGDVDSARDAWRAALDILSSLDHRDAEGLRAKLAIAESPTPARA